ncbi:unnamed protein product [Leuciscus chuanchicus]
MSQPRRPTDFDWIRDPFNSLLSESVKMLPIKGQEELAEFFMDRLIQACRALMITSIVLGAFGLVATLVGMQCSKIGGENYIMKGRIAGAGGVFFILQGLCTMIAVSWYAFNITQEFFDPLYPGIKYEIGEGLYIGWSSAIMALCGGSCLLFSCRLSSPEEKNSTPCRMQGKAARNDNEDGGIEG